MKKFVAMLLMLSMLLSCTAFAAPTGTQTTAQIYINPQLLSGAPEQALTLVDTINSLVFTTTEGENYTTFAYGANDVQVGEYTLAATDEGGLLMFNSLYPNTVILLDFAKLAALIESVLPNGLEEIAAGAMSAGNEVVNMIMPYAQDVSMLMAQMESEVLTDETGASMYLEITSQHLGTLLDAWLTRLSADSAMQDLLAVFYDAATESSYQAPAFNELIAQLKTEAAEMKTAEAMVLGTVGIFNEEGVTTVEITLASNLLVSVDLYEYEGMACMDALAIVAGGGTSDWQATYDGINNGTNYNDIMFGMSTASMADYEYAQLYIVEAGQTVAFTLEETVENANTDAQTTTTVLSIDMAEGDQSINLGGYAAETVLVEDNGMPTLEGKYVLDVMALPIDMLLNGLPQFGQSIVAAMPEAVQLVIDALAQVEGLEMLQGINVVPADNQDTVTENKFLDEIGTEVTENTKSTELEDNATAPVEVTPNVVLDDEIAPMQQPEKEDAIEDM